MADYYYVVIYSYRLKKLFSISLKSFVKAKGGFVSGRWDVTKLTEPKR